MKTSPITLEWFATNHLPRPRAFGGGELLPECDLRQVTPEAAARDFIKLKTKVMTKPFYDAEDEPVLFEITRDKDGIWCGVCEEHRIYCHGDTMMELWQLIHSIVKAYCSRKAIAS